MSASIIPQLLKKDFMLTRRMILVFCVLSVAGAVAIALLFGRVPEWVLINIGFLLLMSPAATCGIVLLMTTVVFEKEKATQAFVMSLPVTPRQYALSKLLLNLGVFGVLWLAISAAAFYFAFGRGLFPLGTLPFVIMVLLGAFVAYVGILSVSLWRQSMGLTVLSIALFEMGTSAYLWIVVFLDPVAAHIHGPEAVWNSTAVGIVSAQALVAVGLIAGTLLYQSRRRDFL
ncbi:MAG: ABC-2 transporter permease [Xanthomonadales bacterium]|nr:ABC-2 transporter permease [Xanthomonadales bacterium]